MSRLYENWGKHKSKYQGLINSKVANDLLSMMAKVVLNEKKTTVSGNIKVNPDRNSESLTGLSDLTITHNVNPSHIYKLTQSGTKTSLGSEIELYKKDKHSFGFVGLLSCNTDQNASSCILNSFLKYDYNNSTNVIFGIENYDHSKQRRPNLIALQCAHGGKLPNGINVYCASLTGYLIKERQLIYQKMLFGGRNNFFDAVLEFNIDKSQGQDNMASEQKVAYDKTIGLTITTNLSPCLTVGGDTEFKINNNALTNRLFTNFKLNNETMLKSKWEDKDKSVTLSLSHCYRGLLTMGMTGKFNMIKEEGSSCKCPMPKIRSKLGFSIEIADSNI